MKKLLPGAFTCLSLCLISSVSLADPPAGIGAAETGQGTCYGQVVVGPPGSFLPFLDGVHGVMLVQLGDAKAVDAKSANGTASFTCHGRNEVGGLISGTDVVTGVPVEGTLSTTRDACAALEGFGLGHACRGNNKGAIILNAEFRGEPCLFGERSTLDWNSVRAPSGEVMLSCHFSE